MAVYKRGGVYWYEFVFKGERYQESAHTGNANTARTIEAAHKTRLAKGEVGIVEKKAAPTLKDFAPRFTAAIETLCASKPATVRFYAEKLRRLLEYKPLAGCALDAIDEALIDAYKLARTRQLSRYNTLVSPASTNRELATLRRLLRLAQEWKVIDRVPRIRLLRGERNREFVLSREQEKLYLAAAPDDDLRDVAILLLDAGLRVSEGLTLDWTEVHMEPAGEGSHAYLKVLARHSKNAKARYVPLTARAVEMLKRRQPKRAGLVFHHAGVPLVGTTLDHQHAEQRKLLKFSQEFVLHSLRHTFGTRLGEAGADAFTIRELMGHSSVIVSQKYVHPTPETVERAFTRLEALNQDRASGVPANSPTQPKTAKAIKAYKMLN